MRLPGEIVYDIINDFVRDMIGEYQVHFVDFVVELSPDGVGDKVLDEVWRKASLGGCEKLQVAEVGAAR